MGEIRLIEVKKSVLADNEAEAGRLRRELKRRKTCLLNLMSSPGAGKTTLLTALAPHLNGLRWGALEADMILRWMPKPWRRRAFRPSSCAPAACAIWTRP